MSVKEKIESTKSIDTSHQEYELSTTVINAIKILESKGEANSLELVEEILKTHADYSKDIAFPTIEGIDFRSKPPQEWLAEVFSLFQKEETKIIDGKLVIIGVCLLDPELYIAINKQGWIDALMGQIQNPGLKKLLSEEGIKRLRNIQEDRVANFTDESIQQSNHDKLSRNSYAKYLAKRIDTISKSNASYAIHLSGPWGSGKSSLLNFIGKELRREKRWEVIEFNAWRNQHQRPVWWALMDAVFRQGQMKWYHRVKEYWWRLSTVRLPYFVSMLLVFMTLILSLFFLNKIDPLVKGENILKIGAGIATLWGLIMSVGHSIARSNQTTAEKFIRNGPDPMNRVRDHFRKIIDWIKSCTKSVGVVVLIDDLDRCDSNYVVELLEAIQTMFRYQSVIFVVAADRRWLNACFENEYADLKAHVNEPGKNLGTLFMEKVFQLTAPVPRISNDLFKKYWKDLLGVSAKTQDDNLISADASSGKVQTENATETQEKNENLLDHSLEILEKREKEVIEYASRTMDDEIRRHILEPFSVYIDQNPRAVKRLLNAYSVNAVLSILSHNIVRKEELALWTIFTMRWPDLGQHLKDHPEDIRFVSEKNEVVNESGSPISQASPSVESKIQDRNIRKLLNDPEVIRLVKGNEKARLSEEVIVQCSLLNL